MARLVTKPAAIRVVSDRSAVEQMQELIGASETVAIGASSIVMRELSIEAIAPLAQSIEPLYEAFFLGGNVHGIILQHVEPATALAVAAGDVNAEELRRLPAGKFVAVVAAAVRVNADFFVQSARLRDAVVALVGAMFGAGQTSSTSSPNTDI